MDCTKEYIIKKSKILDLLLETSDLLVLKFFDMESDALLDEKIQVLSALIDGKTPSEIPNYYRVLELYTQDGTMWDL